MVLTLELQQATEAAGVPDRADLARWAEAAIGDRRADAALVIRVVDEVESQALNRDYRGRAGPTNVLSFTFEPPPQIPGTHLGDLVICAPVVAREAKQQGKTGTDHWAHMVVHGVLHLLGFDHQNEQQAAAMEALERQVLSQLGISDPYREQGTP